MTDSLLTILNDPLDDLEALAEGDLATAEAVARIHRLVESPALLDLMDLVRRSLAGSDDEGIQAADESETDLPPPPPGFQPREPKRLFESIRTRSTEAAAATLRGLLEVRQGRAPVAMVVDAGRYGDRRATAEHLARSVNGRTGGLRVLDVAGDDPFLSSLDERGDEPALILDGDLAPTLVDQARAGGRPAYIVIVPEPAMRALGEQLAPDLVLGIGPARVPPRPERVNVDAAPQLAWLLDIGANGATPRAFSVALPTGRALENLIHAYINTTPAERGGDALRVLRRLSLGPRATETRRVLSARRDLHKTFPPAAPQHALAWSALYRDVGLIEPAIDVLNQAIRVRGWDSEHVKHARAHLYLLAGEYRKARDELPDFPTSPYQAHTKARACRRLGKLKGAKESADIGAADIIEKALDDAPHNLYLLIEAGVIAVNRRQHNTAERRFREANLLAPQCGAVLNAWAHAAAASGVPERAERLYARARELEPWNERHTLDLASLTTHRGLVADAEALLRPLLDSPRPITRRRAMVQLVDTLLEADARRVAETQTWLAGLEEALRADEAGPNDWARYTSLRMHLLTKLRRREEALGLAEDVGRRDNPYFVTQIVTIRLQDRRALDQAEKAIEQLTEMPEAKANPATQRVAATLRARLLEARERVDEARTTLVEALKLDPRDVVLLSTLAGVERRAGNLAAAEALYRDMLDLDPVNAHTHRGLALVLRQRGDIAEAERAERYVRFAGLALDSGTGEAGDAPPVPPVFE